MKILVNGKATGETVENTTELLALVLHYYLYSKEQVIITLEE